uniref:NAD(P)-binding domain-containing protein n=1 Tax=Ditylum brightwellii TaxID=49249 RepID=A0A7S1ZKQ0_9STRA|mmetsp:Transcript_33673/g.50223  ORF Transcript_33673/g.50223 Transcript_33673/m.50223 type:complete len:297 (+) Transcript_33673:66-956(+)
MFTVFLIALQLILITEGAMVNSQPRRVFVSGAGGQTGQHVFRKLLALPDEFEPFGIVRSESSKTSLVESGVPGSSVVVCDITDAEACISAMKGCDAAVICTSAKPSPTGEMNEETGRPVFGFPNGQPEQVDWIGQKNQIDAAKLQGTTKCHVIICSSMGGTNPNHPLNNLGKVTLPDGSSQGGNILKWKRKAESYLMESGLPFTIVHPGGLVNEPGGKRELALGVDDKIEGTDNNVVPREDVAEVMVQALCNDSYRGRSFDLVSKNEGEGTITTDFAALLESLKGKNADYSLGEIA